MHGAGDIVDHAQVMMRRLGIFQECHQQLLAIEVDPYGQRIGDGRQSEQRHGRSRVLPSKRWLIREMGIACGGQFAAIQDGAEVIHQYDMILGGLTPSRHAWIRSSTRQIARPMQVSAAP